MNKKKIVFFGTKKVGFDCLKILNEHQGKLKFELIGVLTNKQSTDLRDYALDNKLKLLGSLDDFLELKEVDIIISVQYHQILKLDHLKKANDLAINLHMAPLPEYRGCNQFSMAIIEDKKIFGTTIHKINNGIDSGDILFESRFKIPNNCWVEDLYKLTYQKSIELFFKSLPRIISLDFVSIPQDNLIKERGSSFHYRKEIENLKKIDLSWKIDKIERHIRATSMIGFEPPYFEINQKKIFFKKELING